MAYLAQHTGQSFSVTIPVCQNKEYKCHQNTPQSNKNFVWGKKAPQNNNKKPPPSYGTEIPSVPSPPPSLCPLLRMFTRTKVATNSWRSVCHKELALAFTVFLEM